MWEYAKEQITREIGAVADLGQRKRADFRFAPVSQVSS
jgi:hypothetical protein